MICAKKWISVSLIGSGRPSSLMRERWIVKWFVLKDRERTLVCIGTPHSNKKRMSVRWFVSKLGEATKPGGGEFEVTVTSTPHTRKKSRHR